MSAPTAAEADAMSTAMFGRGATSAEKLTRLRPALGAVMLTENVAQPQTLNLAPDSYSPPDSH